MTSQNIANILTSPKIDKLQKLLKFLKIVKIVELYLKLKTINYTFKMAGNYWSANSAFSPCID